MKDASAPTAHPPGSSSGQRAFASRHDQRVGIRPLVAERRRDVEDVIDAVHRGIPSPVVQQVGIPQQFCEDAQVYSGARTTGMGAVVGAILLGLIESIGAGYIGALTGGVLGSHYSDIFAFVVLIIVLTLRPSGLLGERVADRA